MTSTRVRLPVLVPVLAVSVALAATLGCSSGGGGDEGTDAASPSDDAATDTTGAGTDAAAPAPAGIVAAGVRWVGRVDVTDPTRPRFSWSGTGFVARFSGTSLTMQLGVVGSFEIFKTVIDGAPQAPFTAAVGQGTYPLASALPAGEHTVEVYRQTEGPQGQSQLLGLTVGDGALMDPPAGPGRLIEVIGDSITCGYGDLGALIDAECISTESHWDTYEAVAARALGAEVSTIAASGRGVIRNYGGDVTGTMPLLYANTLTNLSQPVWDFQLQQPQAVVINLGTNDISNNKGDPGIPFRDTYVNLLTTVRTVYPDAFIVCIIGPLLSGGDLATIQSHIQSAVDMRTAAGDTKVEFFNHIVPQTSDKFACQSHPNVAENMLMADLLAGELRAKLGW
jgi:lysophospholipase L1-like esterase